MPRYKELSAKVSLNSEPIVKEQETQEENKKENSDKKE